MVTRVYRENVKCAKFLAINTDISMLYIPVVGRPTFESKAHVEQLFKSTQAESIGKTVLPDHKQNNLPQEPKSPVKLRAQMRCIVKLVTHLCSWKCKVNDQARICEHIMMALQLCHLWALHHYLCEPGMTWL